jgi:hypothetical protein
MPRSRVVYCITSSDSPHKRYEAAPAAADLVEGDPRVHHLTLVRPRELAALRGVQVEGDHGEVRLRLPRSGAGILTSHPTLYSFYIKPLRQYTGWCINDFTAGG